MTKLRLLGFVFIFVGGVLLAGPMFGFSTISSERGASVVTAPDESAFIALTDDESDDHTPGTIGTLETNVDEEMAIEYQLEAHHDDITLEFDENSGTTIVGSIDLGGDDEAEIEAICGNPGPSGPVTVTAEITSATNSQLTVSDVTTDFVVSCNDEEIAEPGDVEFSELTVTVEEHNTGAPDSLEVEWELEETEGVEYIQFYTPYTNEEVDPESGAYETDDFSPGQSELPMDVTANIDGGEQCTLTFDEGGGTQTLEDCDN